MSHSCSVVLQPVSISSRCQGHGLKCLCNTNTAFGFALPISPLSFQRDETLQDGCDSHICKVNERGEYIWEKRVTGCPPFDEHKCLAEGVSSWSSGSAFLLTAPSLTLRTESSEQHAVPTDMMSQCPRETPDPV